MYLSSNMEFDALSDIKANFLDKSEGLEVNIRRFILNILEMGLENG